MNWDAWAIVAGFIGSVVLTVIATLLIVKWQRQRKELSYRIEVRPFLAPEEPGRPGASWDPNVKIFYGDRQFSQLFPFKLVFRNTGNQTLENLQIRLRPGAGAEILNLIVGHSAGVEVGSIQYILTEPEEWKFKIRFLNEGKEIDTYGIGTASKTFELMVTVPQPGVIIRNRPQVWTYREAVLKALKILTAVRPFPL